jgi:hypothetical protein
MHWPPTGALPNLVRTLLHGNQATEFFFNRQCRRRFAAAILASENFASQSSW